MNIQPLGRLRVLSALLLTASLTACGQLPLDFLQPQRSGLETLSQQIGSDVGSLRFDFEFDDKVSLVPGVCNRIAFECWIPAAAQGAGDSKTASLLYVTLNQTTTGP